MHYLCFLALCVTSFCLDGVAVVNGQNVAGDAHDRRGRVLTIDASSSTNECSSRHHVQLDGRLIMESTNNIVSSPHECCSQCRDRTDCVGWMFRATYHGCALYSNIKRVSECPDFDCEAGVTDNEMATREFNEFAEVPVEHYRGLVLTCGQRQLYESITVVASACSEVQRLCKPASRQTEQKEFDLNGTLPEILRDKNHFYNDYNNGFQEHTLTPEDCRMRCMRQRRCRAWARTQPGQCWLKHSVPTDDLRDIVGDATGEREPLEVQCGTQFKDVVYNSSNSDSRRKIEADNPDKCCEHCINETGCVVWSFIDNTCHMLLNEVGKRESKENATSAFIVTAPLTCEETEPEEDDALLDIAAAYDVECASILTYGPGERTRECSDLREAKDIFDQTMAKFREALA